MSTESILSSAIEIAVGVGGFAGIIAAIRQRVPQATVSKPRNFGFIIQTAVHIACRKLSSSSH